MQKKLLDINRKKWLYGSKKMLERGLQEISKKRSKSPWAKVLSINKFVLLARARLKIEQLGTTAPTFCPGSIY